MARKTENAIQILIEVQQKCEEMYINAPEPSVTLLKKEDFTEKSREKQWITHSFSRPLFDAYGEPKRALLIRFYYPPALSFGAGTPQKSFRCFFNSVLWSVFCQSFGLFPWVRRVFLYIYYFLPPLLRWFIYKWNISSTAESHSSPKRDGTKKEKICVASILRWIARIVSSITRFLKNCPPV